MGYNLTEWRQPIITKLRLMRLMLISSSFFYVEFNDGLCLRGAVAPLL